MKHLPPFFFPFGPPVEELRSDWFRVFCLFLFLLLLGPRLRRSRSKLPTFFSLLFSFYAWLLRRLRPFLPPPPFHPLFLFGYKRLRGQSHDFSLSSLVFLMTREQNSLGFAADLQPSLLLPLPATRWEDIYREGIFLFFLFPPFRPWHWCSAATPFSFPSQRFLLSKKD